MAVVEKYSHYGITRQVKDLTTVLETMEVFESSEMDGQTSKL